ncbi:MAG: glycosyltransferase family 2 protein [Robiginitomaculum sp.]
MFILLMVSLRLIVVCLAVFLKPRHSLGEKYHRPKIWPRYTILVPIYKEAHMVRALMAALDNFDYPKDRLDIIMITEADDMETIRNVRRYLHPPFRLFETAPSFPRTKPKALNKALVAVPPHLIGEIVTIYDAEDRPHPYQLKAAAIAFENDKHLAGVQAPLSFHNDDTNWLTHLFGLEYAALFEVWNPGLARIGLPFTLGGTSNHIRRDILDRAGGWDCYNVTEDADLSFKINALSINGKRAKIGTIGYGTQEEIVSTVKDWTAQRSRWLKGFIQTGAVHTRRHKTAPDKSVYTWKSRISCFLSLPITIGAPLVLSLLHVPSLIVHAVLILHNLRAPTDSTFLLFFFIGLGYSSALLIGFVGAVKAGRKHLIKYVFLMPFYWFLFFPSVLIAWHEYITAPTKWRKTHHAGKEALENFEKEEEKSKHLAAK